jgi:hypothetical protein
MTTRKPFRKLSSEHLLTDEQLRSVGCMVLEATFLEQLLDAILRRLCRLSIAEEELFMKNWQLSTKASAVKRLLQTKLRSAKRRGRLTEIFNRIEISIERRNTVVHGAWSLPTLDELLRGLKPESTVKRPRSPVPIKASAVMTCARELSLAQRELLQFYTTVLRRPLP